MNIYNPYVASITSGLIVYLYTYNFKHKSDKKNKQTNLNYVFIVSLFVFIMMNYYGANTTSIEPTLECKFDE